MRLDLFLKKAKIVKTRSKSNIFCRKGLIFVNNIRAKAAKEVKPNDIIVLNLAKRKLTIRVSGIPKMTIPKTQASSYYNVVKDEKVDIL